MLFGLAQRDGLCGGTGRPLFPTRLQAQHLCGQRRPLAQHPGCLPLFCVPLVPTGAGRLTQVQAGYLSGSILNLDWFVRCCWRGLVAVAMAGRKRLWILHQSDGPKSSRVFAEVKVVWLISPPGGCYIPWLGN